MNVQTALELIYLRVEAEALALGFTTQFGREVLTGCIDDDVNEWTTMMYLNWCHKLEAKYNLQWTDWKELYAIACKLLSEYGGYLD